MKVERQEQDVVVSVTRDEARQLGKFWRVDTEGTVSVRMPVTLANELRAMLSDAIASRVLIPEDQP